MSQSLTDILNNNGIIGYPTETVFGIGCHPQSDSALQKINNIKQRPTNKGLIIVSHQLHHLQRYTPFDLSKLAQPKRATTYIVPCKAAFIGLLTGNKNTIAIRLSKHPSISQLCNILDDAIVSTSLNISGGATINSYSQACSLFAHLLDFIVEGECGNQSPSQIIDVLNKQVLRD